MSGLGDMGNLLKQAQEMQKQIDRVRQELRQRKVAGQAGAVSVEVSADREEVHRVEIAPEMLRASTPAELSDLVKRALQDAMKRAKDIEKEAIGRVTGGMNLPGLF
jgi:DNA-binding YbaB/EbfC family protein